MSRDCLSRIETRRRRAQTPGRWWRGTVGIALLSGWLGYPSFGADSIETAASSTPVPPVVEIAEGKLSLDLHRAELESVLREIAARAAFELGTMSGELGRVTVTFTGVSLEEGLRRLAPEHELMLVYRAPSGRGTSALVEVGCSPARGPTTREVWRPILPRSDACFGGGGQEGATRLALLLGAPDATVRARAGGVLGRIGGVNAEAALAAALGDPAAEVRIQAAEALSRVASARAIPALQGLLLRDPDPAVRRAAARTLGMVRETPATSTLTAAAADPDVSSPGSCSSAPAPRGGGPVIDRFGWCGHGARRGPSRELGLRRGRRAISYAHG